MKNQVLAALVALSASDAFAQQQNPTLQSCVQEQLSYCSCVMQVAAGLFSYEGAVQLCTNDRLCSETTFDSFFDDSPPDSDFVDPVQLSAFLWDQVNGDCTATRSIFRSRKMPLDFTCDKKCGPEPRPPGRDYRTGDPTPLRSLGSGRPHNFPED